MPLTILHPLWMIAFMVLTAVTFSLFGFIVGIWAKNWEQMQLVPMLIVTPLTFLGGAFYSIDMLPPGWRTVALFNPVVYLISGFRWSFFGTSDVVGRDEPRHDARVHARLHRGDRLDLPHRLQAEKLSPGPHSGPHGPGYTEVARDGEPHDAGQASAGRRRFQVRAGRAVAHARALRHRSSTRPSPRKSALEYLKDGRPDVIFMDHLMPGMDGLQAVREIKANPELADIPIMMYTSQEGEIYGGQARASGAIGVLPKSIRPIDVTKALYQLQLLPDRRDGEPSGLEPVGGPAPRGGRAAGGRDARRGVGGGAPQGAEPRAAEVRRRLARCASCGAWSRSCGPGMRWPIDDERPGAAARTARTGLAANGWRRARRPLALAALAILYWQARIEARQAERAIQALTASNDTLTKAIEKWRIAGEASADAAAQEGFRPLVLAVPFGEQALNPARLESVGTLVAQLERAAISGLGAHRELRRQLLPCERRAGRLHARAADRAGRRSASRSAIPSTTRRQGAARQPIAFANLAASVRQRTGGAIELELVPGPRDRLAVAYPPIEQATAGQWNAAAQANNRIEISIVER